MKTESSAAKTLTPALSLSGEGKSGKRLSFRSGLKGGAFTRNNNDIRFVISNPDLSV
jgi:hypothetical protein